MTAEQFAGIVRALLAAAGGFIIAKGWLDANTVAALTGALVTVATAVWSVWAKAHAAPKA